MHDGRGGFPVDQSLGRTGAGVYCSDAMVPTTTATASTIIVGRTAATELVVAGGVHAQYAVQVALVVQQAASNEAAVVPAVAPCLVLSSYLPLGQVWPVVPRQEVVMTSQQVLLLHEAALLLQAVEAAEDKACLPAEQVAWAHVALVVQQAASNEAAVVPAVAAALVMSRYLVLGQVCDAIWPRQEVVMSSQQVLLLHEVAEPEHLVEAAEDKACVPAEQVAWAHVAVPVQQARWNSNVVAVGPAVAAAFNGSLYMPDGQVWSVVNRQLVVAGAQQVASVHVDTAPLQAVAAAVVVSV